MFACYVLHIWVRSAQGFAWLVDQSAILPLYSLLLMTGLLIAFLVYGMAWYVWGGVTDWDSKMVLSIVQLHPSGLVISPTSDASMPLM